MKCRKCGEVYRSENNHQCSDDDDSFLDTALAVIAVSSLLFDSSSDSSNSSDSSSFDGFDGGDFGGGGSSSDW